MTQQHHKNGRRGGKPQRAERRLPDAAAQAAKATGFSPLGLGEATLAAVTDMGYADPTPVQEAAIPAVLTGADVAAAAQTGTGKTAAFLLPSLDRLGHHVPGHGPLMLVVTPTRELAQQIEEVAHSICRRTGHDVTTVVGGVGYEPQRRALHHGTDLLVATPGRLIDLINQGDCNLGDVRTLVLDEADRMLDMGFAPDVRRIVSHIPEGRQTLLFSATLDDSAIGQIKDLVVDPVRVEIAPKGTTADSVEQYVLGVDRPKKVDVLRQVLEREGSSRVIVFCNGKHRADTVCRKLEKFGIKAAPIHGNRSQNQRQAALRRFAKGDVDVLVATDVLARGIDVSDVAYVVNYDVPSDDAESYIHRIGRTGRGGETGWALTFVSSEDYMELRDVEQLLGKVIPDFPRTDGLDLGETPFSPDPDRDPTEKLPSKKLRKRMAEREAARAGREPAPKRGRKPRPRREERKDVDKDVEAVRAELAKKDRKPKDANPKSDRPKSDRSHAGKPRRDKARGSRPEAKAAKPRRRPGDRGGAARRH